MKNSHIRKISLFVSLFLVSFLLFSFRNYPAEIKILDLYQNCMDCHSEFPEQQFQLECNPSDYRDIIGINKSEIQHIPYGTKFVPATSVVKADDVKTLYIFLNSDEIVKKVACL